MADITSRKVKYVRDAIHVRSGRKIGTVVAKELLTLAGGDAELAVDASISSEGLDQCKARIIDERFRLLEEYLDNDLN